MRMVILLSIFSIMWLLLIIRLYHISVGKRFLYEKLARENVQKKTYLKPVRGEILDRNGKFLAINKMGFSISIKPHLNTNEVDKVIKIIKKYFSEKDDINTTLMHKMYKNRNSPYNHKYIKVVDFISYADMIRHYPALSSIEDISVDTEYKRYYPYGPFTAHVIGYVGRSNKKENEQDDVVKVIGRTGKSGLELFYNRYLEGELGCVISKVDARNRELEILEKNESISNKSLKINLDIELQQYIFELLRGKAGVVIVMKTTGEILAAVSNPSFDPNLFVGGISVKDWKALQNNLGHPFTNKFINAVYPPGSVIKMGVALATVEHNRSLIDKNEYCKGYITIDRSKHKFRCWSIWGHKKVGLRKSIRESCDVYYYNKSLGIGIDNISETLHKLGLGIKTGVDLPREYNGIIPNKEWKRKRYNKPWYKGETVIAAIGQGYDNITPLQVARYTAFLATGFLPTPKFVQEINCTDLNCSKIDCEKIGCSEESIKDKNLTQVIPAKIKIDYPEEYMRLIRDGMYDVCNTYKGTAYREMRKLPIKVAGKTGTAQVVSIPQDVKERVNESELAYFKKSHAWITTYAPFEEPEYVVTVLIEHGGHGGSSAGPIAGKIYKWLYRNGYFKSHPVIKGKKKNRDSSSILGLKFSPIPVLDTSSIIQKESEELQNGDRVNLESETEPKYRVIKPPTQKLKLKLKEIY